VQLAVIGEARWRLNHCLYRIGQLVLLVNHDDTTQVVGILHGEPSPFGSHHTRKIDTLYYEFGKRKR